MGSGYSTSEGRSRSDTGIYGVGNNPTPPQRSFFSLDRKERTKEKIKTDGKNDCAFLRVAKTNHIR